MKKNTIYFCAFALLVACSPKKPTDNSVSGNTNSEVTTQDNIETVSVDIESMDKNVRPQDDFFTFANGTWCKNNPVPASESRWGSFNELEKNNNIILHKILVLASSKNDKKGSQNQLLGDYYKSYTDLKTRNEIGVKPLSDRLVTVKNIKSREDVLRVIADMHKVGINTFFAIGVGQDLKDVDKNVAYFGVSGIGLPNRDFFFEVKNQEILAKYNRFAQNAFMTFKGNEKDARLAAESAINFQKRLASLMWKPEEERQPEKTYNPTSYGDFKSAMPNIDFDVYLKRVGCQSLDTVIVSEPDALRQMDEIFMKTSIDQWVNYLSWCMINHYADLLDESFMKLNFSFYGTDMRGMTEMKPITERCIDDLTGSPISELLGKAFVDVAYSSDAQKRVNKMVDNLLIVFRERIAKLDWMSEKTKAEAMKKLNSIGRKLGFPSKWKDFSGIDLTPNNFVQNIDNLSAYAVKDNFSKLNKPVDRSEWGMPAHLVNAYYHPLLNEIAFPAGIMQPPFFSNQYEDAVNYGRIGMVIGHEFTHGFDDQGAQFAADGTFTNWWTEEDLKLFNSKTTTLGETFSAFCPIDGHCVNAELTMGENIADLGGLTMAFYAYKLTDEFKKGEVINGYTPAQRFFIAYAQLWKINYTDAEIKNRIATDPHSPGMYRVNGPLKNCPEFFEAFNVKEGDKMRNPKDKIAKIW